MATPSDRSIFLEATKTQSLTISQIVDTFGVSHNTARVWVKHPEIELVEGSWPRTYRRKNSIASEMPAHTEIPTKQPAKEYVLRWPRPAKAELENLFDKVLDGEVDDFNFSEQFRNASSIEDLMIVRQGLASGLILVEHYIKIRENEGMD